MYALNNSESYSWKWQSQTDSIAVGGSCLLCFVGGSGSNSRVKVCPWDSWLMIREEREREREKIYEFGWLAL